MGIFFTDYLEGPNKKDGDFLQKDEKRVNSKWSSFPKNKELRKGRDPCIAVQPSVSEFEDPNFLQFHMAQKNTGKT